MKFLILLTLISIIRYFISGFFTFSLFNNLKKYSFKIIVAQSALYAVSLTLFKIFVSDNPMITFVSAIAIFGCLFLKNKIKTEQIMSTYSLFMACVLEYIHFIIFELVSTIWKCFEFPEAKYANYTSLVIFRTTVLLLYVLAILLIYKFDKIDIKSVCKLSNYIIFPVFFVISLGVVVYLKYHIKYTLSNEFHDILSVIFVSFIILTFIFIFSSKKFLQIIESFHKKKVNPAIEEAKLQKDKGFAGLIFKAKELNSQMNYFQHELYIIGIDIEDKKAKQLVHCAVLLNQEGKPNKVNMTSGIYLYTGKILKLQPGSVETNIRNILQNHWNSFDSKILKKIEQNYHGPISKENGAPTPREFLLYLVKKYRKDNSINENAAKDKLSFFKKCFLDI